jgi:hypothetical protein
MAINKNFVIKNGAEINTKLLVVDADTQRVGVGTTVAGYTLHVFGTNEQPGGIGASVVNVTGVTTTVLLNVSAAATFSNGPVFIGVGQSTGTPLQPLQVGSATTTKGIYVSGDVGIGETFPAAKLEVVPESTRIAGLFTGTTSDDMVRITQLGSGNALTIEDSANPDSTPVIVDASGDTGIGTDKARAKLHVLPNVNGIAGLFSGSTSNDMVRITQMGEGNALVVEDVVADGTPFIVKATGDTGIGIGSDPIGAKLHVVPSTPGIGGMFTGATAGDMVRITQTGGGNALVVEDEGNPDSSPFTIKASGDTGIGTNSPGAKLHVTPTTTAAAGIFSGTTSADMVRITQTGSGNALVVEDEANVDATSFVVSGVGSVGIGTNVPRYLLDVDGTKLASEGVAVGQTAVYIRGDVKIVGDLSCDDITFDQAVHTFLNVSGFGTITDLLVPETASINIGIITSIQGGNLSLAGITSFLKAPGISTLSYLTGESANYTGISTLARVTGEDINLTGIATIARLNAPGISTIGFLQNTTLNVTGFSTFGGSSATLLNVSGVTTVGGGFEANQGINAARLNVTGITTLGFATAAALKVSGISTLGDATAASAVVAGLVTAQSGISITGGDLTLPDAIIHAGDTNTRVRFPAADTFTVETSGEERLRVTSAGRVGIATDAPNSVLHIKSTQDSDGLIVAKESTVSAFLGHNGSGTEGLLTLKEGGTTRVQLYAETGQTSYINSGNLGIGTVTPSTKLHLSSDGATQLTISNTSNSMSDGDTMGTIDFTAGPSNTINARVAGAVEGTSEAGGDLVFETRTDGGSLGERLRIKSDGKTGIGTVNPVDELHVNSSGSNVNLRLTRDVDTGARISGSDGLSPAFIVETIGSGIATERVRVTSDGNVSIQNDSGKFTAGAGDDLQIYHNGTVSRIDNNVGILQIRNLLDDSDISLQTDNGSGGAAEYVLCDGSSGSVLLKHYGTTKLTTVADGVDFDGTGSIKVPVGTTAQRPTGVAGDFRYNSTLGQFEGYSDSWGEIGGSGGVDETDTSVSTVNPTGVGSFATASFRSAAIIAQIDQTGSGFQVGRYLMIHDGTNVTVVEESAVATGDMLGSFDGAIVGSNAEFRVTMASAGIATVTTKIDTVTV